jgi:hypothetical protein
VSEAAPIKVFIVIIDTGIADDVVTRVGACYWNEQAAEEEAKRLTASHWCTDAFVIDRELDWPSFLQPARPGQYPIRYEK